MARERTGLSPALALVAAFMLFLQSVVHAFAGQPSDILPFDAFGNSLCVTGTHKIQSESSPLWKRLLTGLDPQRRRPILSPHGSLQHFAIF
ncbi:hypothetical protein [Sinorhizobium meliloti]|uniref:hypothetical protein n=1 Tax=Rhizobium meliloti TaxID=382 RepID=UPI001AEEE7B3|nr:hypothetical protein [Sinorhizobium meliloti]